MKNYYIVEQDFIYLGLIFSKDEIIYIANEGLLNIINGNTVKTLSLYAHSEIFKNDCYDAYRFIFDNKKYLSRITKRK